MVNTPLKIANQNNKTDAAQIIKDFEEKGGLQIVLFFWARNFFCTWSWIPLWLFGYATPRSHSRKAWRRIWSWACCIHRSNCWTIHKDQNLIFKLYPWQANKLKLNKSHISAIKERIIDKNQHWPWLHKAKICSI